MQHTASSTLGGTLSTDRCVFACDASVTVVSNDVSVLLGFYFLCTFVNPMISVPCTDIGRQRTKRAPAISCTPPCPDSGSFAYRVFHTKSPQHPKRVSLAQRSTESRTAPYVGVLRGRGYAVHFFSRPLKTSKFVNAPLTEQSCECRMRVRRFTGANL